MSEKDEYQRLASQFVDMWQKNMSAIMNDGEFIRAFLQMMQATSFSAKDASHYGNNPATSSPASPSAAPDAGDNALAGIKSRLDSIEARLNTLEFSFGQIIASLARGHAEGMGNAAEEPAAGKSRRKGSGNKND